MFLPHPPRPNFDVARWGVLEVPWTACRLFTSFTYTPSRSVTKRERRALADFFSILDQWQRRAEAQSESHE